MTDRRTAPQKMPDLVAAGATTPWEHVGGLTAFDRLAMWAGTGDQTSFDADCAESIVVLVRRLAVEAGYTIEADDA